MGRFRSTLQAIIVLSSLSAVVGCGGSKTTVSPTLPSKISVTPLRGSLDIGTSLQMTATALDRSNTPVSVPLTWASSNPAVLTVSNTGIACAGTWDSLIVPQVCTPGGAGVSEITASSGGITSNPVTFFVHQHIDQITISAVPPTNGTPIPPCFSVNQTPAMTQEYQATAFSGGIDITSTVGPFTWSAVTSAVVTITTVNDANGQPTGQITTTPKTPGTTPIVASIANSNSVPLNYTTCAVQQITLALKGSGGTTLNVAKGGIGTVEATVFDNATPVPLKIADPLANPPTTIPLTWSSSEPAVSARPTANTSTATITGTNVGGANITASCAPPTCNIGFVPMQAIYPTTSVSVLVTGTPNNAPNVFVTSSGCGTTQNCTSFAVPITTAAGTTGNSVPLNSTPNSFRFSPVANGKGFLGGLDGLMQLTPTATPPSVTGSPTITGKVLAVSPDGNSVVVSDTRAGVFNQVFVVNTSGTNPTSNALPIPGAVAAAFSPDNLKAFVAANNGSKLDVFSTQAPLQQIALSSAASDVAFLPSGGFGFLAGTSGLSFLATCDNPAAPVVGTGGSPGSTLIRALPDGSGFITLAPPNIEVIPVTVTGTGCAPGVAGGTLTAAPQAPLVFNLGQGNFTPIDFIVSSDGQKAYIPVPTFASIIVFDIPSRTLSSIALVGSPSPLAASITSDGAFLYVSASDGSVHKLDTQLGTDIQQIPIPANTLCTVVSGPQPNCLPDFIAVRP